MMNPFLPLKKIYLKIYFAAFFRKFMSRISWIKNVEKGGQFQNANSFLSQSMGNLYWAELFFSFRSRSMNSSPYPVHVNPNIFNFEKFGHMTPQTSPNSLLSLLLILFCSLYSPYNNESLLKIQQRYQVRLFWYQGMFWLKNWLWWRFNFSRFFYSWIDTELSINQN